ncbi:MAG: hypothetical protein E6Q59_10010 [Nitrosomonas sp.]|nr:MAG: hypothetical protein E6Q59_10010 [Nitrosomonas sp.]
MNVHDKQLRFNALMSELTELRSDLCMVSTQEEALAIETKIRAYELELESFGVFFEKPVCKDNLADKSIRYNTVTYLCSQRDKPIMFHLSPCNVQNRFRYSLYFTFDDEKFDYIQTGKGRRKLYSTIDDAFQDVYRIGSDSAVMLVTYQHYFQEYPS